MLLIGALAGCAGGESAVRDTDEQDSRRRLSDDDRQRARQHFVEGSLLEMQGEHERAIREFTAALEIDENAAIYYAISKNYLELNQLSRAATAGREAVRRDGSNVSYRENLANVYIRAREIDKAAEEYEKIIELDPNHQQAYYTLARLYQFEKPIRSLEVYSEMIDRFGEQIEVLAQIVDLNNSLGRHDDAADALNRMLEIEPGNESILITLGNTYLHAGKYDQAMEIFLDLAESYPDDIEVLTSLVDVYVQRKDYDTASGYLIGIIREQELSLETKVYLGQMFIQHIEENADDGEDAMQYAAPVFDAIIENYPDAPQPRFLRGIVALYSDEEELAAEHLMRVTELDPDNNAGWLYAGEALYQLGNFDEAVAVLKRGLDLHSGDFDLSLLLGLSYNRLDDFDNAVQYLEAALEIRPDDLNGLSMLALTYDSHDRHEVSDSLYEAALELDPEYHLVLNNYSYSLAEREKQLERALDMSQRAVEQVPDNDAYLDTLGWIYFKLGDIEKAEKYVREAIDKGSDSAVVHDHMGDIYYRLGRYDDALQYWEKALKLDESNRQIKEKIERGSI
jgi:tetratricopeptide (TPR) repeat protein